MCVCVCVCVCMYARAVVEEGAGGNGKDRGTVKVLVELLRVHRRRGYEQLQLPQLCVAISEALVSRALVSRARQERPHTYKRDLIHTKET
jgi:hypothetical protein